MLTFAVALAASLISTPLIIRLAHRFELVAHPSSDRWHSRPTALFGGVAIWVSFLIPVLLFLQVENPALVLVFAGVLLAGGLMFLVGLVDDFVHLSPTMKLIAQIGAACILVYCGVVFGLIHIPLVAMPLTIFWVVGITNAFNLLDNMDGLAAGVAAICAVTIFGFNMILSGDAAISIIALAFAGSLLGFLAFNFHPARIFMGDCGSMMIGVTLAGLSIAGSWEQASNTFFILAIPVLLLGVPIFDTAFVTITRRLGGRPVSVGGKDHTSHRLVALGMSEPRAVVLLYAVCTSLGGIALLALKFDAFLVGSLAILAAITFLVFGMFLGRNALYRQVKPGSRPAPENSRAGYVFGTRIMDKQQIVEVGIDLLLFGVAFVVAYLIRFDGVLDGANQQRLLLALPIIVPIKLLTFWAFGLYRRFWDFIGIHDLVAIAKAVVTSTLVSIMAMWGVTRLVGYSRSVFLLDGILLLLFAAGVRILYRLFTETLTGGNRDGCRLLIVGAGHSGEMVLRELRHDPSLGYVPIGFVDDDPAKLGRSIHGVRIFGGRETITDLGESGRFDEIVIAIPSLDGPSRDQLARLCRSTGKVTRFVQPVRDTFLN
ncbi:MAG: hypothetical protein ACE5IK_01825 [Acidobacteriota bacterium]